jgi:transposase-like protein
LNKFAFTKENSMETRKVQLSHVWRERLDRFSRSGLSIAEFCRRHQLSTPSFYLWRKRLAHHGSATHQVIPASSGRRNDPSQPAPCSFVEVIPTRSSASPRTRSAEPSLVEIELPNGARVRFADDQPELLVIALREAASLPSATGISNAPSTPGPSVVGASSREKRLC